MEKALDHNKWSDDDWDTYEQSQSSMRRMLSGRRRQ